MSEYSKAHDGHQQAWFRSRSGLILLGLLAVAAFLLLIGYSSQIFPALPYLLLIACPLMHLIMHGRHHHQRPDERSPSGSAGPAV